MTEIYNPVIKAPEYEITITEKIRRKDGREYILSFVGPDRIPAIELEIYGEIRTCSLKWLSLMTHFEVDLYKRDFFMVNFTPCKAWTSNSLGMLMRFNRKPIVYKEGFRVIPNFTRYAVSREGIVIDTYSGKICGKKTKVVTGEVDRYLRVSVYDPNKKSMIAALLHRLVALAWVTNSHPMKYNIVNHIDGNKQNPDADNLEWVDHRGNILHAYDTRLRSQNIDCRIYDIVENKEHEFVSLRQACEFMSISPRSNNAILLHHHSSLINGRYLYKEASDTTEWNLTNLKHKKPIVDVTIIYLDGTEMKFSYIEDIVSHFNLVYDPAARDTKAQVYALSKKMGFDVIWINLAEVYPIQVYVVNTGEILDFDSIILAGRAISVNARTIGQTIRRGERSVTKGYAYRVKSDKPWDTNFNSPINTPICILGVNIKTQERIESISARGAQIKTGIDRKFIVRALKGLPINGNWSFTYS